MKKFWASFMLFVPLHMAVASTDVVCFNKDLLKSSLNISLDSSGAVLAAGSQSCSAGYVPYNPRSPKYFGWIRIEPTSSCKDLEKALIKLDTGDDEASEIHWLSISQEVQAGKEGFVQLGYENQWDPGAGGTVNAYLKCFPVKR